jgi:hypothetical protein
LPDANGEFVFYHRYEVISYSGSGKEIEMESYLDNYLVFKLMAPGEFQRALRKGRLESFFKRITGHPYHLLSFEAIKMDLNLVSRTGRERQEIRLDQIIGSVDKSEWFTRSLLPLSTRLENRWGIIYTLMQGSRGFPPIEVYKVGRDYFILDGHHRASVARYLGNRVIEAYVIEWLVLPT